MQDPHVVALLYKIETIATVRFDDPPAVEDETDAFRLRLEKGKATFELKDHFSSVEDARNTVDSFIRSWELDIALRFGRQEIKFVFEDAEVIDRNPHSPGSPLVIQTIGINSEEAFGVPTIIVSRREYPTPPRHFRVNPDVDTLWQRFEGYTQGREPLLSMAYFCLTLIETRAGGRKEAEKLHRIHIDVLSKLGNLTANSGDENTARKIRKTSTLVPVTKAETRWIEAAIKAIIRRVGEINSNTSLQIITMSDLPNI